MGFSGVISQVILMFTIVVIIAMVTFTYKTYVMKTDISLNSQKDRLREKLNTNMLILNTTYHSDNTIIQIFLKNTGSESINPKDIDLYVDNIRIPRSDSERKLNIVDSTNIVNPQHWDASEKIEINITKELTVGNHLIEVVGLNGIKNADIIEVK